MYQGSNPILKGIKPMTYIYEWFSLPDELTVTCPKCGGRAVHRRIRAIKHMAPLIGKLDCRACFFHDDDVTIEWPASAYFRCEVKGEMLWAWSEEHAYALKDFISSTDRDPKNHPGFGSSLYHVPKHFLLAKQRAAAIKAIDRMLEEKGSSKT